MPHYITESALCLSKAISGIGNNDVDHINEEVLNSFVRHITVRVGLIRQGVHFVVRLVPIADTTSLA
jgi:hypothetical protein